MAPKKRKKPVANPARGFATTSLPSKPKPLEESRKDSLNDGGIDRGQDNATKLHESSLGKSVTSEKGHSSDKGVEIKDLNPEELEAHLENSELQALVDKHAAKCIAEARRQIARLETERRQLRSQAYKLSTHTWLPDDTIDELFSESSSNPVIESSVSGPTSPMIDEERISVDLWTLERVLQSLNFPCVADAIAHIAELAILGRVSIVGDYLPGLFEAFQWYSFSPQPAGVFNYDRPPESKAAYGDESTPLQMTSEPSTAIQSRQSPAGTPARSSDPEDDSSLDPLSSESDEDDDPAKLTEKYVQLQRRIWETQTPESNPDAKPAMRKQKQVSKLNQRLQKLRRDPLFDEYEAETSWRTNVIDLQADHQKVLKDNAAKRRGRREVDAQSVEYTDLESQGPVAEKHEADADADGLLGGMFGSPDDNPIDTGKSGSQDQVKLKDFGKWTGLSPKKLLDEMCKGQDPKCRIQLRTLQNTSYSARHSVDISWTIDVIPEDQATAALPPEVSANTTLQLWKLEMKTVAAASAAQSEGYICTLALFLVSSLGTNKQQVLSRLPTVWRDVVRDMNEAKQRLADEEHKATLRRIRTLIHDTQEKVRKEETLRTASVQRPLDSVEGSANRRRTTRRIATKMDSEQVSKYWSSRISRPAFQEMLEVRRQLPVHQYKDQILACIAENPVSVICAETGAGKSSGIPVLVLEHEFGEARDCHILVTQPRRISAVTLARRVSQELGESRKDMGTSTSLVGYAIRLESKTSSSTRVTYATTGVLLRMLEESPDLEELDYLVLDEVHERTMDLDLLFIALQKLQKRRTTLKIVLMSATVDARKFAGYFGGAPVLDLPGRTFPVEVGFLEDAVEATNDLAGVKDKALLSQDEGQDLDDFYENEKGRPVIADPDKYSGRTRHELSHMDEYRINYNLIARLAVCIASKPKYAKYSSAILIFMPGIGEMRRLHNLLLSVDTFARHWIVHLLHSTFSTEELERAFERPPRGYRKIVIATNIAETGITIPDVTAVIDTCKEKVMRFDERRQLSRLTEGFISRSSARQRRGRAARVQEGLCFHLVTRHRHDTQLLEQQVPEMLRLSLQDPMLRIKVWDLGSIEETLNAAMDPPSRKNVLRAIDKLKDAGALTKNEALTPLGQQIARLPLEVSLAKLAIFGVIFRCLDPILAMISLLTSKSPFLSSTSSVHHQDDAHHMFSRSDSDLLTSLNAYESWKKARIARSGQDFCRKNHISDQTMAQVEEQKIQLLVYLVDAGLVILDGDEKAALNRARTGGGHRGSFYTIPQRYSQNVCDRALNTMIAMALYPRILMREAKGKGWRNVYTNQHVSLTSRSINHNNLTAPRWLSFYEAMQNRSGSLNVFETSVIPESALAVLLGDAEFRFFAGVVVLDSGKVRLSVKHGRQLMAVKILRERLLDVLDKFYRKPGGDVHEEERKWLDFWLRIEALQES